MSDMQQLILGFIVGCVGAALLWPKPTEPKKWPKLLKAWLDE